MDYTSFVSNGREYSAHWYLAEGSDLAGQVIANSSWLQSNACRPRIDMATMALRLYGGASAGPMGILMGGSTVTDSRPIFPDRITYNVISSVSDTIHSRIVKHKPLPMYLPTGANYRVQRKAKKLTQFIEGLFLAEGAYKAGAVCLWDAIVFGLGAVKVFANTKSRKIRFERVMARDLLWDPVECQTTPLPRSLYQTMLVDRRKLQAAFPGRDVKYLNTATTTDHMRQVDYVSIADQVKVVEAWYLPSAEGRDDGLHVICADDKVLLRERYARQGFPFAFLRFQPRLTGFDGRGVGEILASVQNEINTYLYIISKATRAAGQQKILVERGSKIPDSKFTNLPVSIIEYTGQAPTYMTPPIVAPEVYSHLERLKADAYALVGVSQMSAASQKPAGLDSGKALRTFDDIEADRMTKLSQDYEELYLDFARLAVQAMRESFEDEGYSVPVKGFLGSIDWKRVALEDDQYILKLWPTNLEAKSPASRMQDVQELSSAGFISPREAQTLLNTPSDFEQHLELQSAAEDYIDRVISMIVDGDPNNNDEPTLLPVEQYDDRVMLMQKAVETYNWGRVNNLEEDRLELLRRLMSDIQALNLESAKQQAAQQAAVQSAQFQNSAPMPNPNLISASADGGGGSS